MSQRGQEATLFGHPVGLFTLFFAEMWERFSYYGMRALLLFYMIKGFLGFNDTQAYGVYGAYTALVYATPFIGGVLADKLLGARRAVVIGGILMAAGHLLMTIEVPWAFFTALALLIVGNGFFKPNISTIVGGLYPPGSPKKDAGFTLFYMGINLGAAMSPLLCGYIGETYGWHYGFGLATFGMLVGLAVFVAPRPVAQALIAIGCIGSAAALFKFQNNVYQLGVNSVVAIAMLIAGVVGVLALQRGGIPEDAGLPVDAEKAAAGTLKVYLGIAVSVPVIAILVQRNALAGIVLGVLGGAAFLWLIYQAFQREQVARERMFVVLILMFFSMLFWAFFEQAGSSVNNFTDRNVDRVLEESVVAEDQVGKTIKFKLNQEQVGYSVAVTRDQLNSMVEPSLVALPAKKLLEVGKDKMTGLPRSFKKGTKLEELPEGFTVKAEDFANLDEDEFQEKLNEKLKEARSEQTAKALGLEADEFSSFNTDKQIASIYEKLNGAAFPEAEEELRKQALTTLGLDQETVDDMKADAIKVRLAHVPLDLTVDKLKAANMDELKAVSGKLLGYRFNDDGTLLVTLNVRDQLREKKNEDIEWVVSQDNVGMKTGGAEIPASIFQSVNPIFIILFAPLFSTLWEKLAAAGKEPSTPVKFALGVTQLGLGFACLYQGAQTADERGMVWLGWLFAAYLLQTTGELCLSPVGLSMVTKLSPADIVSTVMGAWFMATAFSNFLAGMIASFTGVSHGGGGGGSSIPAPIETVSVYGDVFGKIALTAVVVGIVCFVISPLLRKWMHEDVTGE